MHLYVLVLTWGKDWLSSFTSHNIFLEVGSLGDFATLFLFTLCSVLLCTLIYFNVFIATNHCPLLAPSTVSVHASYLHLLGTTAMKADGFVKRAVFKLGSQIMIVLGCFWGSKPFPQFVYFVQVEGIVTWCKFFLAGWQVCVGQGMYLAYCPQGWHITLHHLFLRRRHNFTRGSFSTAFFWRRNKGNLPQWPNFNKCLAMAVQASCHWNQLNLSSFSVCRPLQ